MIRRLLPIARDFGLFLLTVCAWIGLMILADCPGAGCL